MTMGGPGGAGAGRPVRLALLVEGGDALAAVGGERDGAPGVLLQVEARLQAHPGAEPERALGGADGERRVPRDRPGEREGLVAGGPGGHLPVDEAVADGLVDAEAAAGEDQVGGPAGAEAAQGELGSAAAGDEADAHLGEAEHRRLV